LVTVTVAVVARVRGAVVSGSPVAVARVVLNAMVPVKGSEVSLP
jgi:hypothetical protein